jgi:hypothetical protein
MLSVFLSLYLAYFDNGKVPRTGWRCVESREEVVQLFRSFIS